MISVLPACLSLTSKGMDDRQGEVSVVEVIINVFTVVIIKTRIKSTC